MDRMKVVFNHLASSQTSVEPSPTAARTKFQPNSPEDVVIVSALRTPIGKSKRGSFKVH